MKNTPLEVDRSVLDLNTVGTISLTKAILRHMIERHEGQIVVVSSVLGKYGNINIEIQCVVPEYSYYLPHRRDGKFQGGGEGGLKGKKKLKKYMKLNWNF